MHLVNMTATLKFQGSINLSTLLERFPFVASRNRGFDAISMMMMTTDVTALVYRSGSVVLVGAKTSKSLDDAKKELEMLLDLPIANAIVIHNMVFSKLLQPVNLVAAYKCLSDSESFVNTSFEPELFPALVCQERGTNRRGCLFRTGKLNITGCKSSDEAANFVGLLVRSIT